MDQIPEKDRYPRHSGPLTVHVACTVDQTSHDSIPAYLMITVAAGLRWTLLFNRIVWNEPNAFDFGSFYRSGIDWNAGLSSYRDARPNLNPPWLTAVLF